jgi:hypothetical protein
MHLYDLLRGPGSSVGIATELRAGRSGDRIPMGATFFAPVQTGREAHLTSCTMGTGGKVRPMRDTDPSPPPSAEVMEDYSYTCTHRLGHTGPVTGLLYLYLYDLLHILLSLL